MSKLIQPSVWVLIPAAGVGKRMQLEIPKQYLEIHNKTIIEHTLECFVGHPRVAGIVVALDAVDSHWDSLNVNEKYTETPIYSVEGGENRSDSVFKALEYLKSVAKVPENTWVMVHDAARPCLDVADINALLKITETDSVGGILASPVRDTMKRAMSNKPKIQQTESRENLWHALTPQLFQWSTLSEALSYCKENDVDVTDESSAVEAMGESPMIISGNHNNIKVTHPSDLALLTFLLAQKKGLISGVDS